MGTTPTLAIPYIEPTDLLANYPTQDKAQADRLEAILTTNPIVAGSWVKNTVQTIANAVYATVAFNSAFFIQGGMTIDAAGVVTVPLAGVYSIAAAISFENNTVGNRYGQIVKNGGYLYRGSIYTGGNVPQVTMTALMRCAAGDALSATAYQNSGANMNLITTNYATTLHIARVGA